MARRFRLRSHIGFWITGLREKNFDGQYSEKRRFGGTRDGREKARQWRAFSECGEAIHFPLTNNHHLFSWQASIPLFASAPLYWLIQSLSIRLSPSVCKVNRRVPPCSDGGPTSFPFSNFRVPFPTQAPIFRKVWNS